MTFELVRLSLIKMVSKDQNPEIKNIRTATSIKI